MTWFRFPRRRESQTVPPKIAASAEATRKVRGVLAEAIVDLDRERAHLEQLMERMLEERAHHV